MGPDPTIEVEFLQETGRDNCIGKFLCSARVKLRKKEDWEGDRRVKKMSNEEVNSNLEG